MTALTRRWLLGRLLATPLFVALGRKVARHKVIPARVSMELDPERAPGEFTYIDELQPVVEWPEMRDEIVRIPIKPMKFSVNYKWDAHGRLEVDDDGLD